MSYFKAGKCELTLCIFSLIDLIQYFSFKSIGVKHDFKGVEDLQKY